MRRSLVATCLALALLLGGCGGSPEDKAKKAAVEFLDAVADRDVKEACKLMADSLKVELLGPLGETVSETPRQCRDKIEPQLGRLRGLKDGEATRVSVTRANAVVDVTGEDEQGRRASVTGVKLRKVQKDWLVTDTKRGPG